MLIHALTALLALITAVPSSALAQAPKCGRETFSKAVDDAAGALRKHSSETQPRILAGIRKLKVRHSWRDDDEADRARALLSDTETEALDQKAAQLLATMDRLSEEGSQQPGDCAKLSELRATAAALNATIRAKTELVLRRLDAALALRPGERLSVPASGLSKAPSLSTMPPSLAPPPDLDVARPLSPPGAPDISIAARSDGAGPPWTAPWSAPLVPPSVAPPVMTEVPVGQWTVTTTPQAVDPADADAPPLPTPRRVAAIVPPAKVGSAKPVPAGDTYSIDEISSVARGGLGSWSASVASVIEHAFSKYGRPTAYVIGEEGGGAFIAGLRYGKGKLFMKGKPIASVYWHGPSVGYDFGAAGSQTLFLIYGMREARHIYRGFSGIDGAAYFIGGAGITFLNNQEIIMAPIRTGLGFRLGASVGYIRFASRPTWNPF